MTPPSDYRYAVSYNWCVGGVMQSAANLLIIMIAGGNHTKIKMTPPYERVSNCSLNWDFKTLRQKKTPPAAVPLGGIQKFAFAQPVQLPRGFIWSSIVFMLTVVQGGTDSVIKALAPITQP